MNRERISSIEKRLQELESERALLIRELESLKADSPGETVDKFGTRALEKVPSRAEEKISLFLSLFRSRKDLYSRLWENTRKGTKGFSPVCSNEWAAGICRKPAVKCHECASRRFEPFDEMTARAHLEGRIVIGSYAINTDDTCVFLAADFDGAGWREDVLAYRRSASVMGIDAAVEISRSGNGAHAWIFFSHSIPARIARTLGTLVLNNASSLRLSFGFESYDRFFPSQDYLPEGGFGNLIALPLQKSSRGKGATVFVDDDLSSFDDQWAYLSGLRRLSLENVEDILRPAMSQTGVPSLYVTVDPEVTDAEKAIATQGLRGTELKDAKPMEIRIGPGVMIDITGLPGCIVHAIRRIATFANPKYFELQRLRFSTWKTPRYISCVELIEKDIFLPRGTLAECKSLVKSTGGEFVIRDERPVFQESEISFTGVLRDEQLSAVQAMLEHEHGVLVAPPGAGKTVMACALLTERAVPTLILVHRKQLIEQWRNQIMSLLGVEKKAIGVLGGTEKKMKGFIDIAMMQSIARMRDVSSLKDRYGMIIVDECHHIPAVSFESVLSLFSARYVLGLTATPYRKDGLQPIIHMQCGPVRHTITAPESSIVDKKVIVRESSFVVPEDYGEKPAIHEIWEALINDDNRQRMIAEDVKDVLVSGRFPLIISDRKEHLASLSSRIRESTDGISVEEFMLTGDMGKKLRKKALDDIYVLQGSDTRPYILSTASLIGEGFDLPDLDTLFITMPVSFKGRVVQYAGRLHRDTGSKRDIIIYDYCDSSLGLTVSMFKKRLSAYREMGYEIILPECGKITRMVKKSR